jgi:cytochrome c biogenesis protein CcmG/thiol:disulfide interchange protein DsbE
MGGKLAVATGLLTGAVVGGALVAGLVLLAPAPTPPVLATPSPTALPSVPASSPPASPSFSPGPSPSGLVPLPSVSLPVPSPSAAASGAVSAGDGGFLVGQAAPALSVKAIDGSTISLAALKGKPVWVNFMATWCPSCVDELPVMNGFAARFQANGLVVVLVDVREDAATVKAFLTSLRVVLPAGLDTTGAAAQAWRATALPMHFWIDKTGIVRDTAIGTVGPDIMAQGLGTILPGVTVTP